MRDLRKLHHLKGRRIQTGSGPPRPNEGEDGEITLRTTSSGLRLFIKFKNKWYAFGGTGVLGVPGGSDTEEVLSASNLQTSTTSTSGRGRETIINTKNKNLEMAGNLQVNKGSFINRDGVSDQGLYFGRDDVAKPGQAYFDDDVFIQKGYKLYLTDGNLQAEADGIGNASWIIAPLDTVVQHVVDGNVYLELDVTNTRVRLKQKALIDGTVQLGANAYMTLSDNEIDVSSGDLTLDVAGDIIADVAGGQFTIKDTTIGDPDLVIESNSNDALAGTLSFKKEGRAGAADDYVGMVLFNGEDAGNNLQNYAYIYGRVDVPTEGEEGGRLELGVASHDGGAETGLILTGGSDDAEVDVAIGKGANSMTTIAGDLDIDGSSITSAGNLEIDTTGHLNINVASTKNILITENTGTYTPATDDEIVPKHYLDTHQLHSIQDRFYFDVETTSRTYFRDIDSISYENKWDAYDSEDDTVVGNTISLTTTIASAGLIVPYDCKLKGVRWVGNNTTNYDNVVYVQTWTGASIPHDTGSTTAVTATLRDSITLTNIKRKYFHVNTALDVSMSAGQMIYPAFQYVSGTAVTYSGSVVFSLERA